MDARLEEELSDTIMGLQRQLNLLKDANKVKRRRAVQKIARVVEELCDKAEEGSDAESTGYTLLVRKLFYETLSEPLGNCLQDASEKPREIACGLVARTLDHLAIGEAKAGPRAFSALVQSLHTRIGSYPAKEESEELRLMQLKLVTRLLEAAPSYAQGETDRLAAIAVACCHDAFPQVKIEVPRLAVALALALKNNPAVTETKTATTVEQVCKALLVNVKHQRFKVRSAGLKGLQEIVKARGVVDKWLREALPHLAKLTHDRTPSVRLLLASAVCGWLQALRCDRNDRAKLVLFVLAAVTDDMEDNRKQAIELMGRLGADAKLTAAIRQDSGDKTVESTAGAAESPQGSDNATSGETADTKTSIKVQTPPKDPEILFPFGPNGPSTPVRRLARAMVGDLVQPIINQLDHWTTQGRVSAAGMTHTLVVLNQNSLSGQTVETLLTGVAKHMADAEDPVYPSLKRTLKAIGFFVPVSTWLRVVQQQVAAAAEGGHSRFLLMLKHLLEGVRPSDLVEAETNESKSNESSSSSSQSAPLTAMVRLLSSEPVSLSDHMPTRFFARQCLDVIVAHHAAVGVSLPAAPGSQMSADAAEDGGGDAKVPPKSAESQGSVARDAFWALLQLFARATSEGEFKSLTALGEAMGKCTSNESKSIFEQQFMPTLARVLGPQALRDPKKVDWTQDTTQTLLLVTLLKRSAHLVHKYLDIVVPIMICACDSVENAPAVRINMLTLLQRLVESSNTSAWRRFASEIVSKVLLPNMVWRNGNAAATIRLCAVQILVSALERAENTRADISALLLQQIETLETCLDEGDVRVRIAMTRILSHLLTHGFTRGGSSDETIEKDLKLNKLYPKLVDRLDDSDDRVRIGVTLSLAALVTRAFPPSAQFDTTGQAFTYIVKHSLIHLDDSNPDVQKAVFFFLKQAAPYNPKVLVQLATAARSRHSTPQYCDGLVEAAQKLLNEES